MKDEEGIPASVGKTPSTVDEYLLALSTEVRDALQHVRDLVMSTAPGVTERISYGIIVFRLNRDLVGLASQKKHCSFYTMSPGLVKTMGNELKGYSVSGATLHFTPEEPLPDALIKSILAGRLAEMQGMP